MADGPNWAPPIEWDEPDAESSEEMAIELERQRAADETMLRRSQMLWENYAGYYGRDGSVVIQPPKLRSD